VGHFYKFQGVFDVWNNFSRLNKSENENLKIRTMLGLKPAWGYNPRDTPACHARLTEKQNGPWAGGLVQFTERPATW
jgi:hypothetical protein